MWKFLLTLALVPAALSLPATDDFNRGPAGSLGGNWTINGSGTWQITAGNNVVVSAAGVTAAWWNADTFTGDQYSQHALANTVSYFEGPACRINTGGAVTMYGFYGADAGIYKWVAGSRSSIGSYTGTFAGADVGKIACTGTTSTLVEVFKNGVSLGSATDSSSAITTGAAGMFSDTGSTGMDDFQANDIGATASFPSAIINAPIRCCKGRR